MVGENDSNAGDPALPPAKLDPVPKPLQSDPLVKIDYDIVYVRAPRFITGNDGKLRSSTWPEIGHPTNMTSPASNARTSNSPHQ